MCPLHELPDCLFCVHFLDRVHSLLDQCLRLSKWRLPTMLRHASSLRYMCVHHIVSNMRCRLQAQKWTLQVITHVLIITKEKPVMGRRIH